MPLKSVPLSLLLPLIPSIFKNRYTFGTQKTKIQGILPGDSNSCKTRLFTFELLFRNLNRRDSPLGSSLVSVEKAADEISSTGGPRRLSPSTATVRVADQELRIDDDPKVKTRNHRKGDSGF